MRSAISAVSALLTVTSTAPASVKIEGFSDNLSRSGAIRRSRPSKLVSRKPHPRYLTGFYVMVSLGGAAGGLFVGLIAPNLFNFYYEFPIGLAMCGVLVMALTPPLFNVGVAYRFR